MTADQLAALQESHHKLSEAVRSANAIPRLAAALALLDPNGPLVVCAAGPVGVNPTALLALELDSGSVGRQLADQLARLHPNAEHPTEWIPDTARHLEQIASVLVPNRALIPPDGMSLQATGYEHEEAVTLALTASGQPTITSDEIESQRAVGLTLAEIAALLAGALNREIGASLAEALDVALRPSPATD